MLLYLTGAQTSVSKSAEAVQSDAQKSLGGYVSSSPVPNNSLNALFDLISMKTLKDKAKETIAIALVNKFDTEVKDVKIRIVSSDQNIANFKVAAVALGEDLCMEHIPNRYAEPLQATFNDVTFYRACLDFEIENCGVEGEEVNIDPMGLFFTIETPTYDGIWQSIENAARTLEDYRVIRLSERVIRIERKDESVIEEAIEGDLLTTEGQFAVRFLNDYENHINHTSELIDILHPGEGIGLWIQRDVSEVKPKTDEQLLDDYDNKVKEETTEQVELLIDYDIPE